MQMNLKKISVFCVVSVMFPIQLLNAQSKLINEMTNSATEITGLHLSSFLHDNDAEKVERANHLFDKLRKSTVLYSDYALIKKRSRCFT